MHHAYHSIISFLWPPAPKKLFQYRSGYQKAKHMISRFNYYIDLVLNFQRKYVIGFWTSNSRT